MQTTNSMKSKEFHLIIQSQGWLLDRINEHKMKPHIITIERSEDLFCAYSENFDGAYGCGETIDEAKKEALKGYKLFMKENHLITQEVDIQWKYDISSLLNYYKGIITLSGIERLTGINQKQLQHYLSGYCKPRSQQKAKILNGLKKLGQELVEL